MIKYILLDKWFLLCLFFVNFFGTIYGYIWYRGQLSITPDIFLLFVPDSPTATLFFTIFLFFFIFKKNVPYIEALAIITLLKYGIWAVVMNLLTMAVEGSLGWQGYMLMASHGAMAIQGLLYAPFYKIKCKHIAVATIWTLHNDIIDYVFGMMPTYSSLTNYMNEIGYFTFWLSILCIFIAYKLTVKPENKI
ncbi:lipoprotein heptaprenylglyceryl N-acetyltransferase LhaT [Virgibacillus ainsalahensis]